MRAPRISKLLLTAAVGATMVFLPALAWAQQPSPLGPLPGQTPERAETPIWLFLLAVLVALLAAFVVVAIAGGYVYLSRRFFAKEEAPPPRRRAVLVSPGMGVPPPARSVGHPVSELPGPAPAQPAPAQPAPAQPAAAEAAAQPQPAEQQPQPARHSGPAELDQETFDRVLKEQLDKGANPKVAEGRARAAAVKAARQKAGAG